MFKRRKPEEPTAPQGHVISAAPAPLNEPGLFDRRHGRAPLEAPEPIPDIPAVPPVQTAQPLQPTPVATPPQSKEPPPMSRPPLQPPTPAAPTVAGPARAPLAPPRTPAQVAERRTLVVGRGISVQGTIQDAERLVVEGTVEASSLAATELNIAQGGVLKGSVEVEDAEISGLMDGALTVRGSLIVRASGQITGEARCRRLQVEDGGQISGKFSMITEPVSAPVQSPSPADAD